MVSKILEKGFLLSNSIASIREHSTRRICDKAFDIRLAVPVKPIYILLVDLTWPRAVRLSSVFRVQRSPLLLIVVDRFIASTISMALICCS